MDFNRLNNLFADDEEIEQIMTFKQTGHLPPDVNIRNFKRKSKLFRLEDDKLFCQHLEVVYDKDKEHILKKLYETDNAVGKGIINFYKLVVSHYLNISREEVRDFLLQQPSYQMTRQIQHRTNKPITASAPNLTWCVDLLDLSNYEGHNNFYKYIFVCVDVFSRKTWIEKMRKKGAVQAERAISSICNRAGIYPNVIMSDNGTEFKGEFAQFCIDHNIKQNLSRTYSPQANGLAERTVQEIRKIIRGFMVKNGSLNWSSLMKEIEENKNNTYNQNIKTTANKIWSPDKEKPDLRENVESLDDPKEIAQFEARKKIEKAVNKFKETDNFEKGDMVRVKMSSLFSGVRKLLKAKLSKKLVITYTPDLFKISKVVIPRTRILARRRYYLENSEGETITTSNGNKKPFYSSELMRSDEPTCITMTKALKLNKVDPTKNDLNY